MNFIDLFTGGGSHSQGTPTTTGAGDGAKGDRITNALNFITGAYQVVTGQGSTSGPAPSTKSTTPTPPPYLLYGGIAVVAAVVLWLVLKRK